MSNRITNFKDNKNNDLGTKLVDRDYLISIYPQLPLGYRLYGWGSNNFGEIGDNTTGADRLTARQEFTSSTNWKQVACGQNHTAAIKTDGTLWCWGANSQGQIGDNTTANRSTPRQEFTSSTTWYQVACGQDHTVAIRTNGTLWAWGRNGNGQLGDNTTITRSTPRQELTSNTTWKQVACGPFHTVAIRTNGTLWTWGINWSDNLPTSRSTAKQEFTSSTNWKQVSAGLDSTAAIKTNGTLWAWGRNDTGQLGDNTIQYRSTPRQEFTSSTNWKQVSCGNIHTLAIKTDGTLWGWGTNTSGHLGDNTTTSRSTARQEFTASTNWKVVFGGSLSTAAIKTNGTLWSWGGGYLGDNSAGSKITPIQEFTSSTNWVQLDIKGSSHTAVIQAPGFIG